MSGSNNSSSDNNTPKRSTMARVGLIISLGILIALFYYHRESSSDKTVPQPTPPSSTMPASTSASSENANATTEPAASTEGADASANGVNASANASTPTSDYKELVAADLIAKVAANAQQVNAEFKGKKLRIHGTFIKFNKDLNMVFLGSDNTEQDHGFILAQGGIMVDNMDKMESLPPNSVITVDVEFSKAAVEDGLVVVSSKLQALHFQDERPYENITALKLLTALTKDVVGTINRYQGCFLIIEGTITGEERYGKVARPFKQIRPAEVPAYGKVEGLSAEAQATLKNVKPFVGLGIFDEQRPDKDTIIPQFTALKIGSKVRVKVQVKLIDPVGVYCDVISIETLN